MNEPFLYLIAQPLEPPYYCEKAPVEFRNPVMGLYVIPMTSRILSGDRDFFTEGEIRADKSILKAAGSNTAKSSIRKNVDNEFMSIRSNRSGIPCTAVFMLSNREKTFELLNIDPDEYYMMPITPDEMMFAEKSKYKPAQIKKTLANIKNKMSSLFPDGSPVLTVSVFEYDKERHAYVEV